MTDCHHILRVVDVEQTNLVPLQGGDVFAKISTVK